MQSQIKYKDLGKAFSLLKRKMKNVAQEIPETLNQIQKIRDKRVKR